MTTTPEALIGAWEQDRLLDEPDRLRERAEVLDRLDAWFPDAPNEHVGADSLHRRGDVLRKRLEATNSSLFQELREQIWLGRGAEALSPCLDSMDEDCTGGDAYDHLDVLVSGVLPFGEPEPETRALESEMVFYQPTPARHVFDLIARAEITVRDVLVDLGAGLGHVPLLVAILTGARTIGIEWEPAYVACAQRAARALCVEAASFVAQDARAADFSTGTVFYLYTPFRGSILRAVLDELHTQARRRPIRICTYGPCTSIIADESWLHSHAPIRPDRVAIFHAGPAD